MYRSVTLFVLNANAKNISVNIGAINI
jgi:hypothetical protein